MQITSESFCNQIHAQQALTCLFQYHAVSTHSYLTIIVEDFVTFMHIYSVFAMDA